MSCRWIHESYSWLYAQQSQSEIWTSARAHGETTPPLYYFILRLWLVFGHSEFALRSFSSLVGTLTIPVVFLIGRVFAGTRAGLIAALLLATSVTHVAFSQEARSYALLMLAASTAVWGVMLFLGSSRGGGSARAAKVPNGTTDSWNRLIGLGAYAVGTTIALYSHNTAVFLPLLANLVVICQRTECPGFRRRTALKWAAANVVPLVLWLWWVPVVLEQARSTENISWIAQPNPIRAAWEAISLYGPMCLPSGRPWSDLAKLALASLIPGLIAIGFWHWRDRRRWVCGLLTFVAGVPLGIWLFGLVARPIWLERTIVWPIGLGFVLAAGGVLAAPTRKIRAVVLGCIVASNLVNLLGYYSLAGKPPWRKVVADLSSNVERDDRIFYAPSYVDLPLFYYTHANDEYITSDDPFHYVTDHIMIGPIHLFNL